MLFPIAPNTSRNHPSYHTVWLFCIKTADLALACPTGILTFDIKHWMACTELFLSLSMLEMYYLLYSSEFSRDKQWVKVLENRHEFMSAIATKKIWAWPVIKCGHIFWLALVENWPPIILSHSFVPLMSVSKSKRIENVYLETVFPAYPFLKINEVEELRSPFSL